MQFNEVWLGDGGEDPEIEQCEKIREELGSGKIRGIYICIASNIDRNIMILFQD